EGALRNGGRKLNACSLPVWKSAELLQHRSCIGDFELPGRLDVERFHDAVVDQHRKTLATRAHAARIEVELEPERFRVSRAAVAHHPYLAAGFLIARPRTHHERVVDRHTDDF